MRAGVSAVGPIGIALARGAPVRRVGAASAGAGGAGRSDWPRMTVDAHKRLDASAAKRDSVKDLLGPVA
jgi:hypothetical protein